MNKKLLIAGSLVIALTVVGVGYKVTHVASDAVTNSVFPDTNPQDQLKPRTAAVEATPTPDPSPTASPLEYGTDPVTGEPTQPTKTVIETPANATPEPTPMPTVSISDLTTAQQSVSDPDGQPVQP